MSLLYMLIVFVYAYGICFLFYIVCVSHSTSTMNKNIPLKNIISFSAHSPRCLLFDRKAICSFFSSSKQPTKLHSIVYKEDNRHCVVVDLIATHDDGDAYITVRT